MTDSSNRKERAAGSRGTTAKKIAAVSAAAGVLSFASGRWRALPRRISPTRTRHPEPERCRITRTTARKSTAPPAERR